ncbi:hypothetical protein JQS43_25130 [Natronosporangium hydrolyticum]|uniref:DUF2231 domain-containing protein n=1 Tax=Natronosporangium hydrolyticum TaxID=2811111 RepID=A0A895YKS5_9ACTN|nr:DUF2231 domain-containing protein [Natronosporangium hydrolyticum]QSB14700.1 hypothetical protein JQS43_25130 [Natronosporangium hydrolyticum]
MSGVKRVLEKTETLERVDRPASALQRWWRRVFPDGRPLVRHLSGESAGHPLHPALVLAPAGAWISASVLDAIPGQQRAAQAMVLTGLLTAMPAAAAGAVDFRNLDQQQRRVGFVHFLANATGIVCYLASYRHRTRGSHLAGQVWGLLGLSAVGAGGALGGHLSYALGAGAYRFRPELAEAAAEAAPKAERVTAATG